MVNHKLFLLILLLGFLSCEDDNASFETMMQKENIRFQAMPGGAMMYYKLPSDANVFAINARYTDSRGVDVLKTGGYGGDSIFMNGFTSSRKNVPVSITLVNHRNEESLPINMTFDTQDSAPYAFFETVKVASSWEGFQVTYNTPEEVSGMVHIFYLGTNPLTRKEDTLLLKSSPIVKGGDTLLFSLQQPRPKNTVVIRTEDYGGYRVRQEVWKDVNAYFSEKYILTPENFIDVNDLSIEDDYYKTGVEYLFDGDLKGIKRKNAWNDDEIYTFLAGPWAYGAPFIIDLKEKKIPAMLRVYGILNMYLWWPSDIWNDAYITKIPCDVVVYGGNELDGDESSWTKIGSYYQDPATSGKDTWAWPCTDANWSNIIYKTTDIEEMDPAYMEISFPAESQTEYRYLKLQINNTYLYQSDDPEELYGVNDLEYITMHELEVYIKKD